MEKPNILWITLDSVRADHTTLFNYQRDTTPELSRIASESTGLNFEEAIAHGSHTRVSVPSILTGMHPSRHRIIGTRVKGALADSIKTVPERFSEQGYRTIGVVENKNAGEAKGFDNRFDIFSHSNSPIRRDILSKDFGPTLVKYAFNTRTHGPGLTLDLSAHIEQDSFFTTDIAKRKLKSVSEGEESIFCYIHYNDPHRPYIPPLSYREEFIDEIESSTEEALAFARKMHENMYQWIADDVPLSDDQWKMLHAMYDATIKYTDACVGSLFDYFTDLFNNTIVVITADHGEMFGEYGLLAHGYVLHDSLIHVPLITHGLEAIEEHTTEPVQHVDIMKTLLSLTGSDISEIQGYDLRVEKRTKAVSQELNQNIANDETLDYKRILQHNSNADLSHLPHSMTISVRTKDFKLVRTEEWTKLYKLPNETDDVTDIHSEKFEELQSFIQQWLRTEGKPVGADPVEIDLSEETEQHLRKMGYLE